MTNGNDTDDQFVSRLMPPCQSCLPASYAMHFKLILSTLMIWMQNRIVSCAVQTTTLAMDLEDGHPNHQLWRKMMDTGRSSSPDR